MSCWSERDALIVGKLFDDIRVNGIDTFASSSAQLQQDIFALSRANSKRGGFFVEIGAADGVTLSNTYLLENKFGWDGILAEAGTCWHDALRRNRRCIIDPSCVWRASGETMSFRQYDRQPEYSGLAVAGVSALTRTIVGNDEPSVYEVETISLADLLERHRAPPLIDYLSIDTEGSEFEIISAFDFSRYDIRVITIEHNYTPQRDAIRSVLEGFGYYRCLTTISKWDDWYIKDGRLDTAPDGSLC